MNQAEWAISRVVRRLFFSPSHSLFPADNTVRVASRVSLTLVLLGTLCVLSAVLPAWSANDIGDELETGTSVLHRERVGGVIGLLGRLHPLVVHFPIALVLMAGVAEVLFMYTKNHSFGFAARWMLFAASAFAVVAVLLGFAAASGKTFSHELGATLGVHRVMGIVTAVLALLTAALAQGASSHGDPWRVRLYRVMLFATMLSVAWSAHSGATLVFGPGYIAVF